MNRNTYTITDKKIKVKYLKFLLVFPLIIFSLEISAQSWVSWTYSGWLTTSTTGTSPFCTGNITVTNVGNHQIFDAPPYNYPGSGYGTSELINNFDGANIGTPSTGPYNVLLIDNYTYGSTRTSAVTFTFPNSVKIEELVVNDVDKNSGTHDDSFTLTLGGGATFGMVNYGVCTTGGMCNSGAYTGATITTSGLNVGTYVDPDNAYQGKEWIKWSNVSGLTTSLTINYSSSSPGPGHIFVAIKLGCSATLGGATTVNVGSTANVTPSTGGTWTSSNTSIATVTNAGVVTGVAPGTVTLTYTETATGCVYTESFTVTAIPNVVVMDNIFMNARTGGSTGYHYAEGLSTITGISTNYNNIYVNGASRAMLGILGTTNYSTIENWRTATSQEANSLNSNPNFLVAGGSLPENYIIRKNLSGTYVLINDDYKRSGIRNTTAPSMGAWERRNNFWKGTLGTDWGTASNWTDNLVPYDYDDVEIATVSNYGSPAINNLVLDRDRIVGNLKNYSSVSLIIPSLSGGVGLTVNDTLKTSGDANLIVLKSSSTNPNGSLIFNKPALNTSVKATVEMYSKAYKGSSIAWPDPVTGQSFNVAYRWQYFGVPVQSITANPTYNGSYVRQYGESTGTSYYYQKWTQLTNTSVLTPFAGYEVTQNNATLFSAQGNLIVGDKTLNLTVSGGYGSGYNIFGNSYTAAIDISKIQFPGSGVDKTVYLYNTGSLKDWGDSRSSTTIDSLDLTPGRYYAIPQKTSSVTGWSIPSTQGFLLIATTNNSSVTIPYNSTTNSLTKNTILQRMKRVKTDEEDTVVVIVDNNLSYLRLDVKGKSSFDRAWIFSQEGTSHEFDNGWDGLKLNGTKGMSIYSNESIGNLQVNTIDNMDSVYLNFLAGVDDSYNLKICRNKNMCAKYPTLYLTDLSNGEIVDLNSDSTDYSFSATNTEIPEKRFLITSTRKVQDNSTPVDNVNSNDIKVVTIKNCLKLENHSNDEGFVNVYDVLGRIIKKRAFLKNEESIICSNLKNGIYIVEISANSSKTKSQKVIIKY